MNNITNIFINKIESGALSQPIIKRKKIFEEIADHIKELIIREQIKPNEKLPSSRSLAKYYGVSVPTIRQALGILSTFGMVKTVHGSGTYVTDIKNGSYSNLLENVIRNMDESEVLFQLTEIRKIFECQVVSLSAERRTNDDLKKLSNILADERIAVKQMDFNTSTRLDVSFHIVIASASQNVIAENIANSLSGLLLRLITMTRKIPNYLINSTYHHGEIYESIASKDSKKAQMLMEKHLREQEKALYELYEMTPDKKRAMDNESSSPK